MPSCRPVCVRCSVRLCVLFVVYVVLSVRIERATYLVFVYARVCVSSGGLPDEHRVKGARAISRFPFAMACVSIYLVCAGENQSAVWVRRQLLQAKNMLRTKRQTPKDQNNGRCHNGRIHHPGRVRRTSLGTQHAAISTRTQSDGFVCLKVALPCSHVFTVCTRMSSHGASTTKIYGAAKQGSFDAKASYAKSPSAPDPECLSVSKQPELGVLSP